MLSTLIFREFRYNGNIEEYKTEKKEKISKNPKDIDAMEQLARIYKHILKMIKP